MKTAKQACWEIGVSAMPGELRIMGEIQQDAYEAGLEASNPSPELKGKIPVVLYFETRREADDFISMVLSAHPNLREQQTSPPSASLR